MPACGIEERCDVTLHGVPYGSLNSGAKVQVGMDILPALCAHYGVVAPLFLDNAESVTRLPPYPGQLIRLQVSAPDKTLRLALQQLP